MSQLLKMIAQRHCPAVF